LLTKGLIKFDISDAHPPYKSVMPDKIPSEKEIEKYNIKKRNLISKIVCMNLSWALVILQDIP
jgi:hypothetical protein